MDRVMQCEWHRYPSHSNKRLVRNSKSKQKQSFVRYHVNFFQLSEHRQQKKKIMMIYLRGCWPNYSAASFIPPPGIRNHPHSDRLLLRGLVTKGGLRLGPFFLLRREKHIPPARKNKQKIATDVECLCKQWWRRCNKKNNASEIVYLMLS